MDLYDWVVFGHIMAVILLFAAHGVSAYAMFRVRSEKDRARLSAILDMSSGSLMVAGIALIVVFVLGIGAAIMGDHFSKAWPWVAIVLLVVITGVMTPLAGTPMTRVRKALGMPVQGDKKTDPPRVPGTDEEVAAAQAALRPEISAIIGVAGVLILSWLMSAKPF